MFYIKLPASSVFHQTLFESEMLSDPGGAGEEEVERKYRETEIIHHAVKRK